ncbi:hypothetical protein INT47_001445 [Mucor saturninus]|uniref:Yeast cell wall synthesis Kre9/Knh1-like N-terminal domain-containing protein n=1 Tax=Mucor saturninus TaxID=64648 RepID=A0A8H7QZY2_9FUNG|nr:hypothetical protein INT47_001445 [Mucor saturninus]
MKSSLFYTIVLASVAAVCAAPASMSDMNPSNGPQSIQVVAMEQGASSTVRPNSVTSQTSMDNQSSMANQGTSVSTSSTPMVKTASQTSDLPDEGYVTFLITSPTKSDTLVKGTTTTIQWINGVEGPFTINVLTGKSAASMQRTSVSLKADGSTGSLDWTVDKRLPAGTYSFQFVYTSNGQRQVTYSDQFQIANA